MADLYRNYLLDKGLLEVKDQTELPMLDLTLLGGYTSDENFLGIPYETIRSLTNTQEALEIVKAFKNDGLTYLNLIYSGIANEGLKPTYMGDIDYDRRTGNGKDFSQLVEELDKLNVEFYPEAYINTAYTDKDINKSKMVVEDVFGKTVSRYSYNPASMYQDTSTRQIFTLKPYTYATTLSNLAKAWEKIDARNIAFTDFGNQLYGSYKKGDVTFRNQTAKQFIENMSAIEFEGMLFRNPNLYALPYASSITDIPLESSNYQIITNSVPFYSLVFSGYLDYSGKSFNTNDSHTYQYNVMKAIETGSNISMTLSYHSTINLVDTEYSIYYSTYYLNWYQTIVETYKELADLGIYNSHLVRHEIVTDDGLVTKAIYDNGKEIVFNYKSQAYQYNGQVVDAFQYIIVEEGTA